MKTETGLHRETLDALADAIIPEADGMPSASQAGATGALLDDVLAVRADLAEPLRACAPRSPCSSRPSPRRSRVATS